MPTVNRILFSTIGSILLVCLFCSTIEAQQTNPSQPDPEDKMSVSALRAQGLMALQKGDNQNAILAADAMTRQHSDDTRALRLAADIYLRTGKVDSAARLFDRYLESEPEEMRGLWQRGIALYFIGDYKRAAKQFEEHRKVNANDVENAAWHFLCVAKAESFTKARELVLPAPGDPRVPLEEIHLMLKSGDTGAVNKRVNRTPADSQARADATFYGDFYLGLYADATGDREKARELLTRTAQGAPHHYMGDIARVYAKHLSK
jgi:lipoprotein NlpI